MILGHWSEEERGGQLVSWSIVVTVPRCGRGTRTRLGAPGPMQWIVGAASVVAAAWRAVAPREVTAAAFSGAGECWRPGSAVQRAGSQPAADGRRDQPARTKYSSARSTVHTSEESSVRLGHFQLGQYGIMGRHLVWISSPQQSRLRI